MDHKIRAELISGYILVALGVVDIIRGFMHTFLLSWAAENIAQIDHHPDALFLLGVFGNSNFLTGFIFILVGLKVREIAGYVLGMIPVAYLVGILGIRSNGITMESAYSGKFMMAVYFGICVVSCIYFLFSKRRGTGTGRTQISK
jgi:hypothetical protein